MGQDATAGEAGKKKAKPVAPALAVSLGFSLAVTFLAGYFLENVGPDLLVLRLGFPLLRLMGFVALGLVVGQAIEAAGWTRSLAVVTRPLFNFARLGDRCGAAFTTAFFSGVAANAMLADYHAQGDITRRQMFLANFLNQVPAYFLHLPTTVFIVLPLTGWAGALYFLLTFSALVIRSAAFLVAGRLLNPPPEKIAPRKTGAKGKKSFSSVMQTVGKKAPRRLAKIAVWVAPIYVLVFTADAAGLFLALKNWMSAHVAVSILPVESLSLVILGFLAEFTSGFAAAGALQQAGLLTVPQTAVALVAGNVLAFPVRALRHQLPRYMGVFTPKTGLLILVLGQGFRIISLAVTGAVFCAMAF